MERLTSSCEKCWQEQSPDILDDSAEARAVDKEEMLALTAVFPQQCKKALQQAQSWEIPIPDSLPVQVVIAGMGGSAAAGDLIQALLESRGKTPCFVNRDYGLPEFVGAETLFVAVSYSGDTEETLAAYIAAKKQGAELLCIASGGKLAELAERDQVPLCLIPAGQPPRTAFGYLFFPLLTVAVKHQLLEIPETEFEETFKVLDSMCEDFNLMCPTPDNGAKQLALQLYNRCPVIYAPRGWGAAIALRWKTQFNENAKVPAFYCPLPEMNHNEIMGWEGPREVIRHFAAIFLRDRNESKPIKTRFEVTKELIQNRISIYEVWSQGESELARIFSCSYLADWVSIYLALLYGTDPTEIQSINAFKEALAKASE